MLSLHIHLCLIAQNEDDRELSVMSSSAWGSVRNLVVEAGEVELVEDKVFVDLAEIFGYINNSQEFL